jgi:hypothetical protein
LSKTRAGAHEAHDRRCRRRLLGVLLIFIYTSKKLTYFRDWLHHTPRMINVIYTLSKVVSIGAYWICDWSCIRHNSASMFFTEWTPLSSTRSKIPNHFRCWKKGLYGQVAYFCIIFSRIVVSLCLSTIIATKTNDFFLKWTGCCERMSKKKKIKNQVTELRKRNRRKGRTPRTTAAANIAITLRERRRGVKEVEGRKTPKEKEFRGIGELSAGTARNPPARSR